MDIQVVLSINVQNMQKVRGVVYEVPINNSNEGTNNSTPTQTKNIRNIINPKIPNIHLIQ